VAVTGRGLAEGVLWVTPARFTSWVEAEGSPASRRTGGGSRCGSCYGAEAARPRQGAAQAGVMGLEVTPGHEFLQWRWPEVVVPPARRASRRATGKGWCSRRRLEGLYTRVLAYFSGKGGRTLCGTTRRGKTAVCPVVRRGARPVGPARRAAGSWSEGGGFPHASVRERPGEGAGAEVAGARRARRRALAPKDFTVPLFACDFLPILK
jgi:hypothetical protein